MHFEFHVINENDRRHGPEGVALESERILLDPERITPVLKN